MEVHVMDVKGKGRRLLALLLAALMMLTSCTSRESSTYSQARELFGSGSYTEALDLFEGLGEYENSGKYAAYIRAWNAAQSGDYEAATEGFSALSGFLDSAEEAREFRDQARRDSYREALSLFRRGEYESAIPLLEELGEYEDSASCLTYAKAALTAREGRYGEAIALFTELGDFHDSSWQVQRLTEAEQLDRYDRAMKAFDSEDFDQAYSLFSTLSGYQDADRYMRYSAAMTALSRQDFDTAEKAFSDLGMFLSSRDMLEKVPRLRLAAVEDRLSKEDYAGALSLSGNLVDSRYSLYAQALLDGNAGKYDEAVSVLSGLGDFLDSKEKQTYFQGLQKEAWYTQAVALFDEGKTEDALALFG